MSRGKIQTKSTRDSKNRAHQAAMREKRMLRKRRAAQFAHLPGQQPTHDSRPKQTSTGLTKRDLRDLTTRTMAELRGMTSDAGYEVRSRHRKADLITMIEEASCSTT